jgi:hypothetical protein
MADIRNKEIQVQKPAQSLAHFQAKLASAEDVETGMVRQLLVGSGVVLVLVAGWFGYRSWQAGRVERFESARAEVLMAIEGDPQVPYSPQDFEKRLREHLPALEKLAREAPGARRSEALAEVQSFHLMLDGKAAGPAPAPATPVAKVQAAGRLVALGQGKEALDLLLPLRGKATASQPWSDLYWSTLLDARRLTGDRAAALKDLSDYRKEFQGEGNYRRLEQMVQGI